MIDTGTVKSRMSKGVVLVAFEHLDMDVECEVMQQTTGKNTICCLPSVGTQVVCSLEAGKNFVLGAVFSDQELVPQDADIDGLHVQIGNMTFDISGNKISLKNDLADLKTVLKDILTAVKSLTVSTSMGPSGTPLPPTIAAIEELNQKVENLLK